jgi:hypothetical protein
MPMPISSPLPSEGLLPRIFAMTELRGAEYTPAPLCAVAAAVFVLQLAFTLAHPAVSRPLFGTDAAAALAGEQPVRWAIVKLTGFSMLGLFAAALLGRSSVKCGC